jgi:hypothetical protein
VIGRARAQDILRFTACDAPLEFWRDDQNTTSSQRRTTPRDRVEYEI